MSAGTKRVRAMWEAGSAMVGSIWTGTSSNGDSLALRIDSAESGTAPNADVWFYKVSYQTTSGWSPLCGLDSTNAPIKALTVPGVCGSLALYATSTTQFTFACSGKSIAKCVQLGYKPWRGYADLMAGCVRLLRADYCGSGIAHTVDGTLLNLYDNVGVQKDTETWRPEAEWTPYGARCINANNSARFNLTVAADPWCAQYIETTTCGTSFNVGTNALTHTLLINELP